MSGITRGSQLETDEAIVFDRPAQAQAMNRGAEADGTATLRIGEIAAQLGISADTIRFYEKAGWLPRPGRSGNSYRRYTPADVEHLRLVLELRGLGLALKEASQLASWCHSGHCAEATRTLPVLLAEHRQMVADRMAALAELDGRLARLERHLNRPSRAELPVLATGGVACCEAATAVASAGAQCNCCAPT